MGRQTQSGPPAYEIRVEGHLDEPWADWLEGLEVSREAGGRSRLVADLPDQAALHGLLARLRDLGIPVISVCRVDAGGRTSPLMRAVVQERYGEPDVLELRQAERPVIGDEEVLVRVRAAGVDAGVWHLVAGRPYLVRAMGFGLRRPRNATPGLDVAGVVETVGQRVTRFQPGDAVFGNAAGAFAEFARAKESQLAPKPAPLTFEQAAAVPNSGVAALTALRDVGEVLPGDHVLVVGASGGVGSYAVQIAKACGAHVTGVASTAKLDLVRALGADEVVDYAREDVGNLSERYDLVVDIGGNRPLSRLRRVLRARGRLVLVGGEGGGRWLGGIDRQVRAAIISRFVGQSLRFFFSRVDADNLAALTQFIESGAVTPALDRSFALADAADAIRYVRTGKVRGKVVITP